jgi:hypothetical protein
VPAPEHGVASLALVNALPYYYYYCCCCYTGLHSRLGCWPGWRGINTFEGMGAVDGCVASVAPTHCVTKLPPRPHRGSEAISNPGMQRARALSPSLCMGTPQDGHHQPSCGSCHCLAIRSARCSGGTARAMPNCTCWTCCVRITLNALRSHTIEDPVHSLWILRTSQNKRVIFHLAMLSTEHFYGIWTHACKGLCCGASAQAATSVATQHLVQSHAPAA